MGWLKGPQKMAGISYIMISLLLIPFTVIFDNVKAAEDGQAWNSVNSFAYQLQEIDLTDLQQTDFDLIIMDYSEDGSDDTAFTAEQIANLKDSQNGPKLVLAYMSIGEAEDYRWYWEEDWDSDQDGIPDEGAPSWLGDSNPDWFGNYKVRYWQDEWKSIVFQYVDRVIEAGFDGLYLDIIDAYEYWGPDGESGFERETAEQEMVDFVKEIAQYARDSSGNSAFGIFPQNGDALAIHPDYVQVVTGIGREDLWYMDNTLQPASDINEGITNLDVFKKAGKLVLVIDYTTDTSITDDFYSKAVSKGYIPYAAVRDLDKLVVKYPPEGEQLDRINIMSVSNLSLTDLRGNELDSVKAGSAVTLTLSIENNGQEEEFFVVLLEVRDELQITRSLQFQKVTLDSKGELGVGMSWTPEDSGNYEIRSFIISNLENPEILSQVFKKSVQVLER